MDKEAFRSVVGKFRHVKRVLQTNPALKKAVVGGAIGGATGGSLNYAGAKAHEESSKYKKLSPAKKAKFQKNKKWHVAAGVLSGGALGASFGHDSGKMDQASRSWRKASRRTRVNWEDFDFGFGKRRSSSREAPPAQTKDLGTPEWLKGVKTKAEAKSKFRQQASQHHPDRGGDENKMKTVNAEWDSFQKHKFHKLGHALPGFLDELEKIYRK